MASWEDGNGTARPAAGGTDLELQVDGLVARGRTYAECVEELAADAAERGRGEIARELRAVTAQLSRLERGAERLYGEEDPRRVHADTMERLREVVGRVTLTPVFTELRYAYGEREFFQRGLGSEIQGTSRTMEELARWFGGGQMQCMEDWPGAVHEMGRVEEDVRLLKHLAKVYDGGTVLTEIAAALREQGHPGAGTVERAAAGLEQAQEREGARDALGGTGRTARVEVEWSADTQVQTFGRTHRGMAR